MKNRRSTRNIFNIGVVHDNSGKLISAPTVRMNDIPFVLTTKSAQHNPTDTLVFGRGCMKGKIQIADDFDAPLDDFNEYMA